MNTFDVRQADRLLLNWCGDCQRVNLELFSKAQPLKAGGTITIEQTYELLDKIHSSPPRIIP